MELQQPLDFGVAFKYPFNRAKGMLNIFWIFLPIVGWFALMGYSVRIIQGFTRGEFKELPVMKFEEDFSLGLMMFLKSLPFIIAYMIIIGILTGINKNLGNLVNFLLAFLLIPLLSINFFKKETVASFFEFDILKHVFANFGDYVLTLLKCLGIALIFGVLSLVLVGIPAGQFTKSIFLADFYRRHVK